MSDKRHDKATVDEGANTTPGDQRAEVDQDLLDHLGLLDDQEIRALSRLD